MTTNQATHRSPNRKELDRLIPSRALPALLDFWTLCDFIGIRKDRSSRLFFWRGAKAGTCPSPVKLSEARIAWRREEWERWLADRPRAVYAKAREERAATSDRTSVPEAERRTERPRNVTTTRANPPAATVTEPA